MNYLDHLQELNNPVPSQPVFFFKPETAMIRARLPFFYPDFSHDLHYEAELVLRICKLGKHIQEKFAHTYYDQIGLGIDFTARDLQNQCRQLGLPWEISKGFDGSAPLGEFITKTEFPDIHDIAFSLQKNGEIVQKGNSGMMIFNFDKIIAYVSQFVTLKIGDLIFTGTPAGVGPVKIGDELCGYIGQRKVLQLSVK